MFVIALVRLQNFITIQQFEQKNYSENFAGVGGGQENRAPICSACFECF